MAGVNEILDARLNLSLSRRLGMTSGPATTLAPEVMPVLSLGEMPELLYHQGWSRWQSTYFVLAAGATAFNNVLWHVPDAATSMMFVLERVVVSVNGSTNQPVRVDLGYGPGAADLGGPQVSAEFRDSRQTPSGATPIVISSSTSAVLVPATAWGDNISPGTQPRVEIGGGPWIFLAGAQFLIQVENHAGPPADNWFFNYVWRQRSLVNGEQMI